MNERESSCLAPVLPFPLETGPQGEKKRTVPLHFQRQCRSTRTFYSVVPHRHQGLRMKERMQTRNAVTAPLPRPSFSPALFPSSRCRLFARSLSRALFFFLHVLLYLLLSIRLLRAERDVLRERPSRLSSRAPRPAAYVSTPSLPPSLCVCFLSLVFVSSLPAPPAPCTALRLSAFSLPRSPTLFVSLWCHHKGEGAGREMRGGRGEERLLLFVVVATPETERKK